MKIKLPIVEIETSKECPCFSYNEYELKIRCMKIKLHSMYLAVIATMICVWLFSIITCGNDGFVGQVSFASTITSIILSVLAIIMSITGEGKTEHIKEQLEATAKDIQETQRKVNEINKSVEVNLDKLAKGNDMLNEKIEHISEDTARRVMEYQNDITAEPSKVDEGIEV